MESNDTIQFKIYDFLAQTYDSGLKYILKNFWYNLLKYLYKYLFQKYTKWISEFTMYVVVRKLIKCMLNIIIWIYVICILKFFKNKL